MRISDIVNDFLMENNLGESEYIKCFHIARRGLISLQKDVDPIRVRACAEVNPDGTIDFPEEATKVYNVGFLKGDKFIPYTVNSNLGARQPKCCMCKSSVTDCDCDEGFQSSFSRSLGVGSWNNFGEYNIVGRKVYLSSNIMNCDVYIEYSTYDQTDSDNYVDPLLEEALTAYLSWKFFRSRPSVGLSEKRDYREEYRIEKRKAKLRRNSMSRAQLNQLSRQHIKAGLKS